MCFSDIPSLHVHRTWKSNLFILTAKGGQRNYEYDVQADFIKPLTLFVINEMVGPSVVSLITAKFQALRMFFN